MVSEAEVAGVGRVLGDQGRPLKERFRALFTLRGLGGPVAIEAIAHCFTDPSALLKHELAYCLGQMGDRAAIPVLVEVLEDVGQDPMVRHEAGEALGAIGDPSVEEVLRRHACDPLPEVAETCQLALGRLSWLTKEGASQEKPTGCQFLSVDPTPASAEKDVEELRRVLLDEDRTLFDRYRAMFALRNTNTAAAAAALAQGLSAGTALFRHEVAYVLGQMGPGASGVVAQLSKVVRDTAEHEMVRHEAAEALGAIATPEAMAVLQEHLKDGARVVRESCEVALDMSEYEHSGLFQYANTLASLPGHQPTASLS